MQEKETYQKELPCHLTDHEILEKAKELAQTLITFRKTEEERKVQSQILKGKMDDMQKEVNRLQREINTGQEERLVDCIVVRDFERKRVIKSRLDTGEILSDREMADHERQVSLA